MKTNKPGQPRDTQVMSKSHHLTTENDLIMVTTTTKIETFDKVVDWDDLEDAVTDEPDDYNPAPWKESDGWDHEVVEAHSEAEDAVGWLGTPGREGFYGVDVRNSYNTSYLVKVDQDWGNADYLRARGASKAVAALRKAETIRSATEQLVSWMKNGWETSYFSLQWGDYHAGLGGVTMGDDHKANSEYVQEVKRDLVEDVASQMEKDGFEVINKPVADQAKKLTAKQWCMVAGHPGGTSAMYLPSGKTAEQWKAEWHRRLHEQDCKFDDDYPRMQRAIRRHMGKLIKLAHKTK